jgi:hypothetical protein
VGEGDVAERGERQDLGDRLGDERKESPRAGVEDQRLVGGRLRGLALFAIAVELSIIQSEVQRP